MKGKGLPEAVLEQFHRLDCVQKGQRLCCALSGGADSVCLLRCLLELAPVLSCTISAVHVNHQLRGEESDRDQQFCEILCSAWNVPLTVLAVDAAAYGKEHRCSEELAARTCRYEAFAQIEADWIVTAHTASDNLETLLHRLIRGSSVHGLAAIPERNGRFLRPMLRITREQVEAYLASLGQDFVTDSSNLTDQYTRNQIRHHVVPQLRQLNPSLERTATYTLASLRREDAYMTLQAQEAFQTCCTGKGHLAQVSKLHPAIGMRCLGMLLEQWKLSYDGALLERLWELVQQGGKHSITRTVDAFGEKGDLYLTASDTNPLQEQVRLQLGENRIYPGFVLHASLVENENCVKIANVQKKFANRILDYDKIKGDIFLRIRQPHDGMQLAARDFTASLKKLIQAKVPLYRRRTVHLLADEAGLVFAEYIGADARVCPDERTRRLLLLEVEEWSE